MLHDPRDLKDERHAAEEDGLQDMNDGEFEDGYQDGLDHLEGFGYLDEDPIQFEDPEENEDRAKDRARIAELMAGIVGGDDAAWVALVEEFAHRVRFKVLGILRDMGRIDLVQDDMEVDGMVMEAFLVIRHKAASWSPDGGALPWNYMFRAIKAKVSEIVGHRTAELNDEIFDGGDGSTGVADSGDVPRRDIDTEEFFRRFAEEADDQRVVFFLAVLRYYANERDYQIALEYMMQHAFGDESPSKTVADRLHAKYPKLKDPNVRKIASRVREKILTAIREVDEKGWAGPQMAGLEPRDLLEIEWLVQPKRKANGGGGAA